jgi:hypothetical protein
MIHGVLVSPSTSWLDVALTANRAGMTAARLVRHTTFQRKLFTPKGTSHYLGNNRLAYFEDLDTLLRLRAGFEKNKRDYVVVLGGSSAEHLEYGLKSLSPKEITDSVLLQVALNPQDHQHLLQAVPVDRKSDLYQATLDSNRRDSLIQKLQPMFYRVREVEDRKRLQKRVYRFLAGRTKTVRDIPVAPMQKLLESPLASRFRECVQVYESTRNESDVKKFGIDQFEVNFVLHQLEK